VELRHLRDLVAVAEELSFTRAAQKLHVAQPSLTVQIKLLEEELGVRLLVVSIDNFCNARTCSGRRPEKRAESNSLVHSLAEIGGDVIRG
jgi:Bacterial regulatory helix-turn-helix protein, lysR family